VARLHGRFGDKPGMDGQGATEGRASFQFVQCVEDLSGLPSYNKVPKALMKA
jgi:hypothetical protein